MKFLIQRVKQASATVDQDGSIYSRKTTLTNRCADLTGYRNKKYADWIKIWTYNDY